MELELLGLGSRPAKAAAVPAATEAPSPVRGRMRRRPADTDGGSCSRKVRVPGAAGDRSPRASHLGSFRGMVFRPPPAPGHLAAAGQAAQVNAMATIAPPPLLGLGASAPAANGFGRPPPFAAAPTIFEGSAAAAASSSVPDHPTAPLTIIYAGSVRAFDGVPLEQRLRLQTKPRPFQQPEPAAAIKSSSAAQMMMLLGLANANDSLLPKRTASLARFLHRRKQRVERAATMPYPRGEVLPAQQMDPSTAAYARDIEQPWASEDGPKSMKENHGEEAVNTDLFI